ncbi:hypothetical protein D5045_05270 [Verminephrobacter eiseniae]|nr:hypothetical protein [Verminephrobacter eiseniae]
MYPAMMNPLDRDLPMRRVSRHRSDVVGCAQPSERSARRIAPPIPSVLASDATPRCASMASADRQMIGDATLEPVATPRLDLRHVLMRDRLSPIWCCARHGFGNRPGFGKDKARLNKPQTTKPAPGPARMQGESQTMVMTTAMAGVCNAANAPGTGRAVRGEPGSRSHDGPIRLACA